MPLKVDNSTGKLTLQSSELGAYHYELHLKATPPMPERPVHFTTTLGNNQSLQCYFTSYAKGRTEYTCKVCLRVCLLAVPSIHLLSVNPSSVNYQINLSITG